MKILILSFIILLVSTQANSQIFGKKKSKADSSEVVISDLTFQLDSVTVELAKYKGVYDTLKKKIVHYNFDPASTTFLIDSLMARRDSTSKVATANCDDTIAKLNKKYNTLKAYVDSAYSASEQKKLGMIEAEIEKANTIAILKQLRELVSAKILTEEEFATLKRKYLIKL